MSEIKRFESSLLGEHYYKVNHDSGLSIYVFPKDMSTTYGILSANFGGNAVEYLRGEEKVTLPRGCAHFLEHKLFENPDGTNADEVFAAIGAYDNAYTSSERTAYLFSATEHTEEALSQLLYFVTHPYFTDESVAAEQGIIGEEIRRYRDNPYTACFFGMLRGMYRHHGIREDVCGTLASIKRSTLRYCTRAIAPFITPKIWC